VDILNEIFFSSFKYFISFRRKITFNKNRNITFSVLCCWRKLYVAEYLILNNGDVHARIFITGIHTATQVQKSWDFEGNRKISNDILVLNGYLKKQRMYIP
jgi:hypothetical protein